MSYEPGGDFDRMSDDLAAITAREGLLARLQNVRASVFMPDRTFEDTRAVSRRFSILAGPNQTLPVNSERLILVPKPRQLPVESIDNLRVYQPLLPISNEDDHLAIEEQSDSRFVFFEGKEGSDVRWRFLLSTEGLCQYTDSSKIAVVKVNNDMIFRVKMGSEHEQDQLYTSSFEHFTYPSEHMTHERANLEFLAHILDRYEPQLQSNEL